MLLLYSREKTVFCGYRGYARGGSELRWSRGRNKPSDALYVFELNQVAGTQYSSIAFKKIETLLCN